jgi:hypothetical protein
VGVAQGIVGGECWRVFRENIGEVAHIKTGDALNEVALSGFETHDRRTPRRDAGGRHGSRRLRFPLLRFNARLRRTPGIILHCDMRARFDRSDRNGES